MAIRESILHYAAEVYGTEPEYLWQRTPDAAVLRHKSNRKWYGLILRISKNKLGLDSQELVDILNIKCDTQQIGSLQMKRGFFPAYHMNKSHWLTILLDGTVPVEEICVLLDWSFELTAEKQKP